MQNPAADRRMRNTKSWPAGCVTPNRGPQDVQDQRVGNKGG